MCFMLISSCCGLICCANDKCCNALCAPCKWCGVKKENLPRIGYVFIFGIMLFLSAYLEMNFFGTDFECPQYNA